MDNLSESKQASRIEYIEIFKAIGILLMIMGHVGFGGYFQKWIHFFHMPMFFIASGYLYKLQGFRKTIVKRVRTLLVPYFVFGLLHCGISFIRNGRIDPHAFYLLLWENTAETGIPIAGALWFLTAMFITEVLFWCLQRIHLTDKTTAILAAVIAIAGMACATFLPVRLPWAMDAGMVGVGLYEIGKIIKDKIPRILLQKSCFYFIGIIVFSALGLFFPSINLRLGKYGLWPMFWVNAVGMTISLLGFSKFLDETVGKRLARLASWIKSVGRESIVYLCLNQLTILITRDCVEALIPYNGITFIVLKN